MMSAEDPPGVDENHPFYKSVVEAANLEREAMAMDTNGDKKGACAKYEESARKLNEAVNIHAPKGHADVATLMSHSEQILRRTKYLKECRGTPSDIDTHIKSVQLTMQASSLMQDAQNKAGGSKKLAAAAGLGALGGFVMLGGVGALAGAAGGLYAVTQPGNVGVAARSAADSALTAGAGAKEYNEKHQITNKAFALGKSLLNKGAELNEKHDITGRISSGVTAATNKAKEVNEKHDITGKTGAALSQGMEKMTESLNKNNTNRA